MNPDYYGIVEMVFSFGIVIAFGVWQLVSLERSKKKSSDEGADSQKDRK